MIGYTAWFCVGLVLAAAAARWQRRWLPANELTPQQRRALPLFALGGAILGAYLLQLPADLLGLQAPAPGGGDALPLGGRTVLGGLLGGWLAVEAGKRLAGVRAPTGDTFALPLACALACGRLGCLTAGCCAGAPCAAAWWATHDALGVACWPVQAAEATFHFAAAVALVAATRRNAWPTARLGAYLTVYAVVRFALEFVRQHPAAAFGLTWHQYLAVALGGIAGVTWWRRTALAHPGARSA